MRGPKGVERLEEAQGACPSREWLLIAGHPSFEGLQGGQAALWGRFLSVRPEREPTPSTFVNRASPPLPTDLCPCPRPEPLPPSHPALESVDPESLDAISKRLCLASIVICTFSGSVPLPLIYNIMTTFVFFFFGN